MRERVSITIDRDGPGVSQNSTTPVRKQSSFQGLHTVTSQYAATSPMARNREPWASLGPANAESRRASTEEAMPRIHSRASMEGSHESPSPGSQSSHRAIWETGRSPSQPSPTLDISKIAETDAALDRLRLSLREAIADSNIPSPPPTPPPKLKAPSISPPASPADVAAASSVAASAARDQHLSEQLSRRMQSWNGDAYYSPEHSPLCSPTPAACVEHHPLESTDDAASKTPLGVITSKTQPQGTHHSADATSEHAEESDPRFLSPNTLFAKVNPPKMPVWPEDGDCGRGEVGEVSGHADAANGHTEWTLRTSDDEMGHRSKQRHFASLGVDTLESDVLDVNDGAAHRLDNSGSTDVHASLVRSPPTRPFEDVLPSPGGKTRRGVCRIQILSGRGFPPSDSSNLPSPTVWLSLHHHTPGAGASLCDVAFKAHLIRPQFISGPSQGSMDPTWNEELALRAAYLSTQSIKGSEQRSRLSSLRGGGITLLATLHRGSECFAQAACSISAPTRDGESQVDAWLPLLKRDGTQVLSHEPLVPVSLHIRATYFVPLSAEQAALQQSQARRTLGMRTCSPIPSPTKTAAAASQSRFETHETSPKMPLYASSRDASKSPASQRSLSPFTPRVRVEHAAAQPAAFLRCAGGEGRSFQSPSVSPPAGGSFSLSNTDKSLDEFWVLEEAEVYARMGIEMRERGLMEQSRTYVRECRALLEQIEGIRSTKGRSVPERERGWGMGDWDLEQEIYFRDSGRIRGKGSAGSSAIEYSRRSRSPPMNQSMQPERYDDDDDDGVDADAGVDVAGWGANTWMTSRNKRNHGMSLSDSRSAFDSGLRDDGEAHVSPVADASRRRVREDRMLQLERQIRELEKTEKLDVWATNGRMGLIGGASVPYDAANGETSSRPSHDWDHVNLGDGLEGAIQREFLRRL